MVDTELLSTYLDDMDIPSSRRDISKQENIRWLARNVAINNGQHVNIDVVKQMLRSLLKEVG